MAMRRILGTSATVLLTLALAGPVAAAQPEVITWSNPVDRPFLDCGTFEAHGVWTVRHVLTLFPGADGTPIRDIEQMSFVGSIVNPDTGASIEDSGKVVYFDTLAPDGSYLTTYANTVRRSDYFTVAGRQNWQDGSFHGVDRFDVNIPAACAALGA